MGTAVRSQARVWSSGPVQQDIPGAVSNAVTVTDSASPHWLVLTSSKVLALPMAQVKSATSVAPRVTPRTTVVSQPQTLAQAQYQSKLLCGLAGSCCIHLQSMHT